jgi:predicted DNA-binding transcriptional regulator YafY
MNKPGKPAKKYSQAARLHDTIRTIESRHGISIDELAECSGVNRRTINRDLNSIAEAGYPLTAEWVGDRKLYRFITGFKDVPPIGFSLQELLTLYFLRSHLETLQGTPFHDDLEDIFRKINSVLPPRYAAHLERLSRITLPIMQGVRDYSKSAALLTELRRALLFQQKVKLHYKTPSRKKAELYTVDPYSFIFYKGGLYLQGYAHNRLSMRIFAVERITAIVIMSERFEIPSEYLPEKQFSEAFGIVSETPQTIRLRFAAVVAHSIADRIWHPTQKIKKLRNGELELSFTAGGKMEIISWILSYGGHVELLEPEELRLEIAEKTRGMAEIYQE